MALFGFLKKEKDQKNKKKQSSRAKKRVTRTVKDSIPFLMVYGDGSIETDPGTYTRAFHLQDVNFTSAADTDKAGMFRAYEDVLNAIPPGTSFQVIIHNHPAGSKSFEKYRYRLQHDSLNQYRTDINRHLFNSFAKGKNNLEQDKYMVIGATGKRMAAVFRTLDSVEKEVRKGIGRISKEADAQKMLPEEILKVLFDIYNQDGSAVFYSDTDKDGNAVFSFDRIEKEGLKLKDVVGPSGMEFNSSYFKLGETFGRVMHLQNSVATELSIDFMADLTDISSSMLVSVHYEPVEMSKGIKMVEDHLLEVNTQVATFEQNANKSMTSFNLIPPRLRAAQKQSEEMMDEVIDNDQKLFYVTFTVCVFADNLEQLDSATRTVQDVVGKYRCSARTLTFLQEQGLNTSLPLCRNELHVTRLYTTLSSAAFIPYTTMQLHHEKGIFYGINEVSRDMILYDRTMTQNKNGLILGQIGGGKSFMAKMEMLSVLLRETDTQVYVIDPEDEYTELARALGGEVVDLSPGSRTFVNPLDMDTADDGETDPFGMKVQYIISLVEIMIGEGMPLTSEAKTILKRCVQEAYRGYLEHMQELKEAGSDITCDRDAMPTLSSLYAELNRQYELYGEPEARKLASILEFHATGSFATFSHRSNVETDARFVVYNTKNLGSGMKELGLYVCMNDVWLKMLQNSKKGIYTRFYIDEMHWLLQSESATKYLAEIWKRARKWGGIITGITQNALDLTGSTSARNIVSNTSFVIMMRLAPPEQATLTDLLGIPDTLMEHVNNAARGHGLIHLDNGATVPFSNEFPEDTAIHALLSKKKQ